MEIIQRGKALAASAPEAGGRSTSSVTCPPPPLAQLSLVWAVVLLCEPALMAQKQTREGKEGTENVCVRATAESATRYLQPPRSSACARSGLQLRRCLEQD